MLSVLADVHLAYDYAEEIAAVLDEEIFQGANGKFNPDAQMTRGQMASVLVRAFDLSDNGASVSLVDLEDTSAAHRENIKILAQHGVTEGKVNDQGQYYFDARGDLTRAQFSLMLFRVLNIKVFYLK